MLFVLMSDVTQPLKLQLRLCDDMYQEAIEANYTHEQMTALNSILGNIKIVLDDFKTIIRGFQGSKRHKNQTRAEKGRRCI